MVRRVMFKTGFVSSAEWYGIARTLEEENMLGATKTILTVEDERDPRDLLSMMLQAEGYSIILASDGRRGGSSVSREAQLTHRG